MIAGVAADNDVTLKFFELLVPFAFSIMTFTLLGVGLGGVVQGLLANNVQAGLNVAGIVNVSVVPFE